MAITYILMFEPQAVPNTDLVLYTVPGPPTMPAQTIMKSARIRLANTTGSAATATMNIVKPTGSVGSGNIALPAVTVNPNDYLDVDVPDMLAGYTLHITSGTANALTVSQLDGFLKS
jgi:hypothetical protein